MRFTSRQLRHAASDTGMTILEVLMAVLILTTVIWGALAFMLGGRTRVELANQDRVAAQVAMEQLERARAGSYDSLNYDGGSMAVDGIAYDWILFATPSLADPNDSDSIYKTVEVTVYCVGGGGQVITLHSAISP